MSAVAKWPGSTKHNFSNILGPWFLNSGLLGWGENDHGSLVLFEVRATLLHTLTVMARGRNETFLITRELLL